MPGFSSSARPVLVAVAPGPIVAGLRYAAQEAARARCGVHLIHVLHAAPRGLEVAQKNTDEVERVGRQTLAAALETARGLVDEATVVTGELARGAVVPSLVRASPDARMVVLQHREISRIRQVVSRSVTSGVAAHAPVPVVSVPSRWTPGRAGNPTVTVGVDVPERAGEVVRVAADAARLREATLHVLHTWDFPSGWDELAWSPDEQDRWGARASAELQAGLDNLAEVLAGVPLRTEVRRGRPADALIQASRNCELLVIGRHDALIPIGSHIGPVARSVLREAVCPLLLVPPQSARRRLRHHGARSAAAVQPS